LRPNACGAILSLVYNRGTSTVGDSRREMKVLQKQCIPNTDYACIAEQIRSMTRLWRGTVNENGLTARREAEAILAETP
jgi:GH24 family phage-related lysozyme (muramidase)